MKIKAFLKLVEIQTKVASVIPFMTALVYVLYSTGRLNAVNMVVMFFSMLIFDMTVTALNNYFDYKRAEKKHGYNYEIHNSIVQYQLKISTVRVVIIIMIVVSAALGLLLVYLTNVITLVLGAACFAIGIVYSYGPMPISRTPFGEIFSGLTMGLGIPFITYFINVFDQNVLNISLVSNTFSLSFDLYQIVGICLVSLPAVFGIANIMLANNICDMEDDLPNKRYTLPIVVGKERAIVLLKILFALAYAAIVAAVVLGVLPLYSLLTLLTIIPLTKNIKRFTANPTKKDTFGAIVGSFVMITVSLIITIGLGVLDAAFLQLLV
ncbi:MAG TPA: 1,4-dihydroxy-2-naphthoate polyprenyltransferase [Clostridiales bacterium]|nr:1,4-dihydroxy-2-naphthoate polyprenyltransferase [Clostridiales bacterium]